MTRTPIIDMHCDLLVHMLKDGDIDPNERTMGASFPCLEEGNVKLQVMAIYTGVEESSARDGVGQSEVYKKLLEDYPKQVFQAGAGYAIGKDERIGMVAALESASGICNETAPLSEAFDNLETILSNVGRLFYISLTHHFENRFGGGNYSEAGLKPDGEALLDYISGRQIAIDLSHTSVALAEDLLNYTAKPGIDIPVIASHSNFKQIWDHPRNLTNEHAQEVINRGGLIGMNFLRAFTNNDDPSALLDHMAYAVSLEKGEESLCFGADFFYTEASPDPARIPYYFPQYEDATKYQSILNALGERLSASQKEKMAHQNVERFIAQNWT